MFGQGLNFGGLTGSAGFDADFLVIAGGASGGVHQGGGGGAGGLRTSYGAVTGGGGSSESSLSLTTSTNYTVTVGPPGAAVDGVGTRANDGTDSSFLGSFTGSPITSTGGGGGGTASLNSGNAYDGGSGGGGSGDQSTSGGSAVTSPVTQGYAGGNGIAGNSGNRSAAGGGGASAAGGNATLGNGGNGGNGLSVSITGSSVIYAGGGGGSANNNGGNGGTGGGGTGATNTTGQTNGSVNTGGGGGGNDSSASGGYSGAGGSGTVILRYPTAKVSSYAVTGTLDTVANTAYPIANTIYYKLNGGSGTTVTDSSGNGYNGTATSVTYVAGRFGQAAQAGTSSRINTGYIQNGQVFSVSFWGKGAFGTGGSVFRDTPSGGGSNTFMDIATNSYGQPIFGGNAGLSPPGATPSAGWTHYVFCLDGTNSKIYVNSVEVATGTYTAKTGNNGTPVCIFANGLYPAGFASGIIDQARVFNSAISAGNVTSLYNESTVVESTDGTDSILQFIGGSGDITFS